MREEALLFHICFYKGMTYKMPYSHFDKLIGLDPLKGS